VGGSSCCRGPVLYIKTLRHAPALETRHQARAALRARPDASLDGLPEYTLHIGRVYYESLIIIIVCEIICKPLTQTTISQHSNTDTRNGQRVRRTLWSLVVRGAAARLA